VVCFSSFDQKFFALWIKLFLINIFFIILSLKKYISSQVWHPWRELEVNGFGSIIVSVPWIYQLSNMVTMISGLSNMIIMISNFSGLSVLTQWISPLCDIVLGHSWDCLHLRPQLNWNMQNCCLPYIYQPHLGQFNGYVWGCCSSASSSISVMMSQDSDWNWKLPVLLRSQPRPYLYLFLLPSTRKQMSCRLPRFKTEKLSPLLWGEAWIYRHERKYLGTIYHVALLGLTYFQIISESKYSLFSLVNIFFEISINLRVCGNLQMFIKQFIP
jgi:hypothetical protein